VGSCGDAEGRGLVAPSHSHEAAGTTIRHHDFTRRTPERR